MSFWNEYEKINNELIDVKKMILYETKNKYLGEVIAPMVYSSGKMLRPAFVLISGMFGDYDIERLKKFAVVIEILHMATLIHDDIIDDAELRRGVPSIQAQRGKNAAVFIGDYYLCQCFIMLSKDYEQEDLEQIARVMNKVCLAEVQQNYHKRNLDISVRNYLKVISGKTAALFALSCYMGAKVGQCDHKTSNTLGKIGQNIGMAFQIIDDILDYSADQDVLGKESNKDIQQGYYTLPLIYALNNDSDGKLRALLEKDALTLEDHKKIVELVHEKEGITYARNLAHEYANKAFALIEGLPACESKDILLDVAKKLIHRNY